LPSTRITGRPIAPGTGISRAMTEH
jgi:hypothetical protein